MNLLEIDWMLAFNQYRLFLREIQASNDVNHKSKQSANLHIEELASGIMEDIVKAIGFITSDSSSDREFSCLSRLFLGTLLYLNLPSTSSVYNLACILNGFEAETSIYFL